MSFKKGMRKIENALRIGCSSAFVVKVISLPRKAKINSTTNILRCTSVSIDSTGYYLING